MKLIILVLAIFSSFISSTAQIPPKIAVDILKAEDARSYNQSLANLLKSPNPAVQMRATLAAGRIGSNEAVPVLIDLLDTGLSPEIRAMAAFAIGEIESIKGVDGILKSLKDSNSSDAIRARAVEAAGKIVAANASNERAKPLGEAILDTLEAEEKKGAKQSREVVLQAITAALRAKPNEAGIVLAKFLTNLDARIRGDAGNAISRLRAKNANAALRAMLMADSDAVARSNAARALGAAEDKEAFSLLLEAAIEDDDSRVRVSAIRSLASLKDPRAADPLLKRGETLLAAYKNAVKPNFIPSDHSEFLEIATALGRLLANTDNLRADKLFADFGKIDKGHSPEVYIARTRIGQKRNDGKETPDLTNWRQYSTLAQIVGEFASIEPTSETGKQMKTEAPGVLRPMTKAFAAADPNADKTSIMAGPNVLQAYARFKTADLGEIGRLALRNRDLHIRAAAAGIIGGLSPSPENISALSTAFEYARVNDITSNDALLAILDALIKLDAAGSNWPEVMGKAIISPDHHVRQKVRGILPAEIKKVTSKQLLYEVTPYFGKGTKVGQVLNKEIDYLRALKRRNGSVSAVLTTLKGSITIDLFPEEAPLTVDNFVKLARSGYFNGLEVHRVVPNFVMQDGDPRGDGNGGPGWSIRCEVNMLPYDRGAVGMALSGKDTGGSQWFITHAPQPHLDGGYTVFGRVNETDMKVVDNIVRGDRIISVRIVEKPLARPQGTQRRKE